MTLKPNKQRISAIFWSHDGSINKRQMGIVLTACFTLGVLLEGTAKVVTKMPHVLPPKPGTLSPTKNLQEESENLGASTNYQPSIDVVKYSTLILRKETPSEPAVGMMSYVAGNTLIPNPSSCDTGRQFLDHQLPTPANSLHIHHQS